MPERALLSEPLPLPEEIGHHVESDSLEPDTGSNSGTAPFHGKTVPSIAFRGRGMTIAACPATSAGRHRSATERIINDWRSGRESPHKADKSGWVLINGDRAADLRGADGF